jgi:hypothetical protein
VIAAIIRHLRRGDHVAAEQEAAQREAAAHSTAIRQILDQGQALPDPAAARTRRTA